MNNKSVVIENIDILKTFSWRKRQTDSFNIRGMSRDVIKCVFDNVIFQKHLSR